MGVEQLLVRGLLGGVQGGADSVVEQEKFARENKAKEQSAALAAQVQTDRDAAIELARSQREAANETARVQREGDQSKAQHGYRMEEIGAEGKIRQAAEEAKSTKKPVYPNIVKLKDEAGVEYLIDENSGAIGRPTPESPGLPAKSHWFKPDEPAVPGQKGGIVWTASDGTELPGGIADLYQQIKQPAKSGAAASGLPPGSRQIGTSGGKPVYQTPDGRKLIGD